MNRVIALSIAMIAVLGSVPRAADAVPPAVVNVFDTTSGAIISSSFGAGPNWEAYFFGLTPSSGDQFFESDNGNFNHDFVDLQLSKLLGGVIANQLYNVSFYIAANDLGGQNMSAVEFSDFSALAIGGAAGTMNWISTPTPVPDAGWVKWSGLYTPSPADIGDPFQFRMIVDIDSRHSLALDGPMTARAIPEPSAVLSALAASLCLSAARRRRVRRHS